MFEDFCFDINYYYFTFLASFSSHCPFLLFSLSCSGVTLSHLVFLLLFAYRMLSLSCNLPSCLSFLSSSIPLLPPLSLLYFCYILLLCDYLFCSILFYSVLFYLLLSSLLRCIGLCLCLWQLNDLCCSVSFLLYVCQSRLCDESQSYDELFNLFSCTLLHHNVYKLRWWYILILYHSMPWFDWAWFMV